MILTSLFSYGQGNGLYEFKSESGKYGFMDKTGKIRIKAEYLRVGEFNEGLCYVSKEVIKKGYKWIFIDTLENNVFDIQDNFPKTGFKNGFAQISNFQEDWFVNKKGINQFRKTWQDAYKGFNNGIAYVSDLKFSDYYPINLNGERVSTKTFSRIEIYNSIKDDNSKLKKELKFKSDKFIPFQENELWGFIDNLNNIVIEPKFYLVDKFQNGVCAVRIHKQEFEFANDYFFDAIINEEGKILIEIEMHSYLGFKGELIKFYDSPHFGGDVHYINIYGKVVSPNEQN